MQESINLKSKFELFSDHWAPKVIAQMNDYQFKLVRLQGEFVWHEHTETDETFLVIEGSMSIEYKHVRGLDCMRVAADFRRDHHTC